jgi:hypothetical protein
VEVEGRHNDNQGFTPHTGTGSRHTAERSAAD